MVYVFHSQFSIAAGIAVGDVASAFSTFLTASLVEVYLHLAVVFLHHWPNRQESAAKAY